jgi:hypothetical protein
MRLERLTAIDRFRSWISAASDRTILRRSVVTCLIVGAILTVINQGDRLLRGEFDAAMAWKIGLTFFVPFVVATISGAAVIRSRDDSSGS